MINMKMSDLIAQFIAESLSEGGGVAELQRKTLADRFSCVPSQINYVIETRFTPENGYRVESQRGGGGYIRIVRVLDDKQEMLLSAARSVGGRLTQSAAAKLTRTLISAGLLTQREGQLLIAACSDGALADVAEEYRDQLRATVFRCAVMGIAT
jgi:transcriptional regulator CtsR